MPAGILIALAVGLKPQIGLPFLVYQILRRRWVIVGVTGVAVVALMAATVFRLTTTQTSWVQSYLSDNRVLFASGSLGDFTEKNPLRYGLINLQVLVYTFCTDSLDRESLSSRRRRSFGLCLVVFARIAPMTWKTSSCS